MDNLINLANLFGILDNMINFLFVFGFVIIVLLCIFASKKQKEDAMNNNNLVIDSQTADDIFKNTVYSDKKANTDKSWNMNIEAKQNADIRLNKVIRWLFGFLFLVPAIVFVILVVFIIVFIGIQTPFVEDCFDKLTGSFNAYSVKVNDLTDFNYKMKEEIYDIRKHFVSQSIFADKNYTPSEAVFGAIEDGKPWVGIRSMNFKWNKKQPNSGLSEESRFINNPSALVMVNMAYAGIMKYNSGHFGKEMYLLPSSIRYNKEKKHIIIKYNHDDFNMAVRDNYRKQPIYELDGINAHDFNYPWASVYKKSNIEFKFDKIEKSVIRFHDMLHTGMSAGIPGGTTNSSPYQEEVVFKIEKLPAYIKLKLWRERPDNIADKPDFYVDIYLDC